MGRIETAELLRKYEHYLGVLEGWAQTWGGGQLDMLHSGEVFDILWLRDRLAEARLSETQGRALRRADELLIKHRAIVAANMPPRQEESPESRWWWHMDEDSVGTPRSGAAQFS